MTLLFSPHCDFHHFLPRWPCKREIMVIIYMKAIIFITNILCFPFLCAASLSADYEKGFCQCFSAHAGNSTSSFSDVIFTQESSAFLNVLQFSMRNARFLNTSERKPIFIVTPYLPSHVQAAIICSKEQGLLVRIRSGGHDYEGLSYVSDVHFIIIDLVNFRSIRISMEDETAWVGAGAILGELYHAIAMETKLHAFPAGTCPTVGVGGHLSGGGFGTIFRKYGLAADNAIDAKVVDVNGRLLDRKLMGEDLFWAIRGGGGSSFGVIIEWRIKLVRVPPTVTIFSVGRTLEEGASLIFTKWQHIADKLDEDLFLHASLAPVNSSSSGKQTVMVSFSGMFLGTTDNLLPLIQNSFSELGLQRNNCKQMNWIESVLYFAGHSINDSVDVLLNKNQTFYKFKGKSDYVKEPIPEIGLEGLWTVLNELKFPSMILTPYGGKMNTISESEIPFPHRRGNIYGIQYLVYWNSDDEVQERLESVQKLYAYMAPFVSKSPRKAYLNYRDLDLGVNCDGDTSYEQASMWGLKYFNGNFKRLALVKTAVDPDNFFRNEQSIPVLLSH